MPEIPPWRLPVALPPVVPQTLSDGSRLFSGCTYAIVVGYRPIELDVRVPAGDGPWPAVVWIHGGGYALGDRRWTQDPTSSNNKIDAMLRAGIAVVSLDYRLGHEARFPAALHDAKAALRWIAQHASTLGIDAERVGIWGESAGGHLAGLTAATQGNPEFDGAVGVTEGALDLRALVVWFGAMHLPTIVRPDVTPEVEAMWGGDVPEFVRYPPEYFNLGPDRYQDIELRTYASAHTHATAAMPPSLFIHGDADNLVPIQQSEIMVQRLTELGCDVTLHRIPSADHGWAGVDSSVVDDIVAKTVAFLTEKL